MEESSSLTFDPENQHLGYLDTKAFEEIMVSKVFKNMEDLLDKKIFAKNNLKTAYRKLEIDIETKNQ